MRSLTCNRSCIPTILVVLLIAQRASASDVAWLSPSAGDIYGSADTLVAKWTAGKDTTSPSFRLCMADDEDDSTKSRRDSGGCGSQTWPDVSHSGDAYMMTMTVPEITADHDYYISMEDDFGTRTRSPVFSLTKSATPVTDDEGAAQAPLGAAGSSLPLVADTAPDTSTAPPATVPPNEVLSSRTPVPTAAFAVPLSIVGAILLIAVFLGFRQRNALQKARQHDAEKLSRQSSLASSRSSSSRSSEIDLALAVLKHTSQNNGSHPHPTYTMPHGYGCGMPVPLYAAPVEVTREPHRSTRQAYRAPPSERHRSGRDYHEPSLAPSWLESQRSSRSSIRDVYHDSPRHANHHSSRSSRDYSPSGQSSHAYAQRDHRPASRSSRDYYPSMDYMLRSQSSHLSRSRSSLHPSMAPLGRGAHPLSRRSTLRSDASGDTAVTESVLADYADFDDDRDDERRSVYGEYRERDHAPPSCLLPAPQRLYVRTEAPDLMTSPGIEKYLFMDKPLPGRPM